MKKFVTGRLGLILIGLLFLLFHIIFWPIVATGNPARITGLRTDCWLGFVFINVAFLLMAATTFIRPKAGAASGVALAGVYFIPAVYLFINLLMNTIIMCVNQENIVVPIVLNAILLVLAAMLWFVAFKILARLEGQGAAQEARMFDWRMMTVKAIALKNRSADAEINALVEKFADTVKNSSSRSVPESVQAEADLEEAIAQLDAIIEDGERKDDILKAIDKVNRLLKTRNQIIMMKN